MRELSEKTIKIKSKREASKLLSCIYKSVDEGCKKRIIECSSSSNICNEPPIENLLSDDINLLNSSFSFISDNESDNESE